MAAAAATATMERLTIEIELPSRLAAALRAAAEAQGRSVGSLIAESLDRLYSAESEEPMTEAEIHAALYGPARPFEPARIQEEFRIKYGTPDFSHLTRQELEEQGEELIRKMDPAKRAEMRRQGLL